MKKAIIAALLIGVAGSAWAQDAMRDKALQLQAGQEFAEKLVQNALTIGKTGDVLLTSRGPHGFDCGVRVKNGAGFMALVTENADTPERACVKAVLALGKDRAL